MGCCGGGEKVQETPEGKAAAEVAVQQYNTYMQEYRPFENKFIADVMKPTAIKEAKISGKANADLMQKAAIPSDPSRMLRNPGAVPAMAKIKGRTLNNAVQGVRDQQVAGMQAITDMGMGKEVKAQQGYDALASNATDRAISSEVTAQQGRNAIAGGIMDLAGAGAAIYKNMNKRDVTDGTNGVVSGPNAGQNLYAGNLLQ